jgi:hypothetical protein
MIEWNHAQLGSDHVGASGTMAQMSHSKAAKQGTSAHREVSCVFEVELDEGRPIG